MKKLLYIDACLRGDDSRTRKIAKVFLSALKDRYEIETVELSSLNFKYKDHIDYLHPAVISEEVKNEASKFADADLVVLATPFFDMGLPAIVHTYLENISIDGITFKSESNKFSGLVKTDKVVYITTRGATYKDKSDADGAYHYLVALGKLWGYQEVIEISAVGQDTTSPAEAMKSFIDASRNAAEIAAKL